MAKRRIHPSVGDLSGTIANLVYYERNGKPLIRRTPNRSKPFTHAELQNQTRFRLAQSFAAAVLADPHHRVRYEKAAAGLDVSAQNLAVRDFYRHPTIAEVDLSTYTGRAGECIRIRAEEGAVGAAQVLVSIRGRAEAVLEEGQAIVGSDGQSWWYTAQIDLPAEQPLWIKVTAVDQPGNRTETTVCHLAGS